MKQGVNILAIQLFVKKMVMQLTFTPSFAECARAIGVANGGVVRNALLNNFSCKVYKIKEIDLDFCREFKLKQANVT